LVVPSLWYETYSFSLHEAHSCGIPVVASKVGVLAEKLKEGETGLTFPLEDEEALTGQLRLLLENPTLLNAMKHNLERFDPPWEEEEAYAYERIYDNVCHPGAR
jgi:glycosyltransferase involved in cell wall biosynthesis